MSNQVNSRKDDNRVSFTPSRSLFDNLRMPMAFDEMLDSKFFRSAPNLTSDIWEENGNYMIKVALPGVKKEDIEIEIDDNIVTVSAEAKTEESQGEESDKKYFYKSMETSFMQSFNLPRNVNANKVEAKCIDGVLSLKLPKAEKENRKKISVS